MFLLKSIAIKSVIILSLHLSTRHCIIGTKQTNLETKVIVSAI